MSSKPTLKAESSGEIFTFLSKIEITLLSGNKVKPIFNDKTDMNNSTNVLQN